MAAVLRSVVAPLGVPLLTAGHGLLGVLLAWLWYLEDLWWLTIVVAAGSLAAVVLLERCGDAAVTSAPVKAVTFYEARFTAPAPEEHGDAGTRGPGGGVADPVRGEGDHSGAPPLLPDV